MIQPRRVSFSTVNIREYDLTVGDQPLLQGPPVALDWNFQALPPKAVEAYETSREGLRRRRGPEMRVPASIRAQRLRELGNVSLYEIQQATNASRRAMVARLRTAQETKVVFRVTLAWESLGRKVTRALPPLLGGRRPKWPGKEYKNNNSKRPGSDQSPVHQVSNVPNERKAHPLRHSDYGPRLLLQLSTRDDAQRGRSHSLPGSCTVLVIADDEPKIPQSPRSNLKQPMDVQSTATTVGIITTTSEDLTDSH